MVDICHIGRPFVRSRDVCGGHASEWGKKRGNEKAFKAVGFYL